MALHQKLTMTDLRTKSEPMPIKCIDITEDKKFAYIWM
jgi:hypothetical protein